MRCPGERLNGIQEVSGSIPLISTKKQSSEQTAVFFFPNHWSTADLLPSTPSAAAVNGPRARWWFHPADLLQNGMSSKISNLFLSLIDRHGLPFLNWNM